MPPMAIDPTRSENELTASKTERLRLMTLLSLYDMLPHSISRPPTGQEPMDLDDAIDQETVNRVLTLVRATEQNSSPPTDDDRTNQTQDVGMPPPITRAPDNGSRRTPTNGISRSRNSRDGGIDRVPGCSGRS